MITSKDVKGVTNGDKLLDKVIDNEDELDYRDYEDPTIEEVWGPCPDCASEKMMRYARQSGPDDFTWVYECRGCGSTWEE